MKRWLTGHLDRDAYIRAQEAMVARERQRAARRAQLHNVKSIADPTYVAGLEKVDLETLTGDEISTYSGIFCMDVH